MPFSRPEPGGAFTFNVVVTNASVRPVKITTLTDNIYGNVANQGSCTTAIGTAVAATGGTYSCSFTGTFSRNAGSTQTDVVTVVVTDDDGSTATETDDAVVSVTAATAALPTISVGPGEAAVRGQAQLGQGAVPLGPGRLPAVGQVQRLDGLPALPTTVRRVDRAEQRVGPAWDVPPEPAADPARLDVVATA